MVGHKNHLHNLTIMLWDAVSDAAVLHGRHGPEAARGRVAVQQAVSGEPPKTGGILAALRRSPMVGADVDLARPREEGCKIEL